MLNQRFTYNRGLFKPKENGIWELIRYSPVTRSGAMDDGAGREWNCWDLLNGWFTDENLFPRKRYWFLVDQLIYHEKGSIVVEGIFPEYKIKSTGQPVWRDHDGSFRFVPVDFISRYVQRRKNMEQFRQIRYDKKKVTLSARGWRRDQITFEPRDACYIWTLRHRGVVVETGTAESQVKAEVTSSKRLLTLKRSWMNKRVREQKIS